MLAFLFRSLVINFPFIHWIKTLYKCLTFPFFIPFKKGIKTLHKSLVFLLKDAFKIFLLSKELKPFIKVTISLYRIPFIKGIEILYKGLAFPQKFVNFYSVGINVKLWHNCGEPQFWVVFSPKLCWGCGFGVHFPKIVVGVGVVVVKI